METPIIELQDVRKSFGPVEVLKGVNMAVYPGKVTALVGDNGAGKSTSRGRRSPLTRRRTHPNTA